VRHGELVGGRYRLDQALGTGGMGEVWSGFDEMLRRRVAIKVLLIGPGGDRQQMERLRQEAQAAAGLHHPGITAVYDIGEHERLPYLVMELLNGRSLASVLEDHPAGLPVAQVIDLMAQVADALGHAHAAGVIHRDIKPANLMLMGDGSVKICDFGISRYAEATAHLTQTGAVLGTPAYMAPEQWEIKPADARTDLYALGVTLHALLTGKTPFEGPSPAAFMRQHLLDPPPHARASRRDIPLRLDDLLQRLLAKQPGSRPATAADVRHALAAAGGDPVARPLKAASGRSPADMIRRSFGGKRDLNARADRDAGLFAFMLFVVTGMAVIGAHAFYQAANEMYLTPAGVHQDFNDPTQFFTSVTDQLPKEFFVVLAIFGCVAGLAVWEISLRKLAGSAAGEYLGRLDQMLWVERLGGLALLALLVIGYQYSTQPCFNPSYSACGLGQTAQAIVVTRNLWYACVAVGVVEILVVLDLAGRAHRAVARAKQA
jgi:hypothetical protein